MKTQGTILLVDDEKNILNALKRLFVPLHYTVLAAQSAQEGLDLLDNNPIDIIISDMRMPEMDGAAFLKIASQKWPNTKRLLLTGHSELNSAINAINEGKIDFYLHKPWENEQLIKIVHEVMEAKLLGERNLELQNLIAQNNEELKILNSSLEEKVAERTTQLRKAYNNLETIYDSAIEVFLSIVDLYEESFSSSARIIANHARMIASQFKLPEDEIRNIYLSAMLHRIGKLGLPQKLKTRALKAMTIAEFAEFAQYPLLGAEAFSPFKPLDLVAESILSHRERFDGSGFPNGLKGMEIPLASRIVGIIVEYYDLQTGLIYPIKMSPQDACNHIVDHKELFDPEVLDIFLKTLSYLPSPNDTEDEEIKFIMANHLKPGMVLAKDLISNHGFVLIPKDKTCTPELISKLKSIDNLVAYIKAP